MSRNPHIKPEHCDAIVASINAWDRGAISWAAVCKLAKPILGYLPGRSALSAHASIQAAFTARKKNLGQRADGRLPTPSSLAHAARVISAKNNEIAALDLQVTSYRDKFDRWRYNALSMNIRIDQLDAPLPPINRSE